jgi:microcystin-dependent protein
MAEPDQIDFATVANARWGVVEGCEVNVSGTLAQMAAGVVVINGALFSVRSGSVPLGFGQPSDRFDLIAADQNGIRLIDGVGATDPVFPDVPMDCVLLAAVFCSGPGPYTNNVIDKRRMVSKALLTKLSDSAKLIQNVNGNGDTYRVLGSGHTTWGEDTYAYRSGVGTLTIEVNLVVPGAVTVGGAVAAGSLRATGLVSGSNLAMQTLQPATAPLGALWQNPATGTISVYTTEGWKPLGFVEDMVPAGTVVMSLESVDNMLAKGWIPMDGRDVVESVYPSLFMIDSLMSVCNVVGTTPNRKMTLPNANGQVLKITNAPGVVLAQGGTNKIRLTTAQMPAHRHNVAVGYSGGANPRGVTSIDGAHNHTVVEGGTHAHDITDPGHNHIGVDWNGNRVSLVALAWGGNNKIDALFNDRNHTYSVEAMDKIYANVTGIKVVSNGSAHSHTMSDHSGHTHPVTIDAIPQHKHDVTEDSVGGDTEITIDPPYIALHAFIRS